MNISRCAIFRLLSLAPVLAAMLAACGDGAGQDGEGAGTRAVAVEIARVESRDVQTSLHSVGRLVSRNTPLLAAEVGARVMDVRVDDGETVEQGQVLIRLDTTAFELARREAQAAIQSLVVSIANEERRVSRYRDLKTTNAMSQERLDDAEAKLAADRASMAAAEARLAITEDRLSKAELRSPVNGVVEKRHVSVGDYVQPGSPMLTVTDTRNLRAELPFPETVGHLLQPGQRMMLESPIAPGQVYEATVDLIKPQVGMASRSLVAIAHISNPGEWRPEATVEAVVVVENRPSAAAVPVVSLVERPAGQVVYVLDDVATGIVRQQVVEPGQRQNGWIEILSGLEVGETVVSDGAHYLSDGARVSVRDGGS
ncbi:MAG: efflux RND transporter periplasmic adaptor subunit [Xanthomonadales bacterium]|jgi:RND family efflux transporter MFP subunit|nr:efflux RND transporter periplasmic adaptor subunit [Xanthomonadales bacterium]